MDQVLIPSPYWVSYPEMTIMAGAIPKIISCPFENDFLLEPEQLENEITDNSRILILCSPSNPTGAIYSRQGLISILNLNIFKRTIRSNCKSGQKIPKAHGTIR